MLTAERSRERCYRLGGTAYLERFTDEALLLVASRRRLLTVNLPAADLFDDFSGAFAGRLFTGETAAAWLAGRYDLPPMACRVKARGLLAFALRHDLVRPAGDREAADD